jgi:hypothetical protein
MPNQGKEKKKGRKKVSIAIKEENNSNPRFVA